MLKISRKRNFLLLKRSLNYVDDKWQKIIKFGKKNHELIWRFKRGYLVFSTTLIVCFYLKLRWKQNSTENVRLGPSNQQIKLQPTILQYPLTNYLVLNKVSVMKWKARKGPNKQVLLNIWLLLTFFKKGINLRFRKKSWNKLMFNMWK